MFFVQNLIKCFFKWIFEQIKTPLGSFRKLDFVLWDFIIVPLLKNLKI